MAAKNDNNNNNNNNLIDVETNLVDYWRAERGNARTAAAKVTGYWKLKKQVCGAERYLLDVKGHDRHSAVSPRHLPCFDSLQLLPRADAFGQDVLWIKDTLCSTGRKKGGGGGGGRSSKVSSSVSSTSSHGFDEWRAALFHALARLCARLDQQHFQGLTVVVQVTQQQQQQQAPNDYQSCIETLFDFMDRAFLLWIKQIHIITTWNTTITTLPPTNSRQQQFESLHNDWLAAFDREQRGAVSGRICLHAKKESPGEILQSLKQAGLVKESLTVAALLDNNNGNAANSLDLWCDDEDDEKIAAADTASSSASVLSSTSNKSSSGETASSLDSFEESSLRALQEAIALLPEEDRRDYCRAEEQVPDIVKNESDPLWFLRFEKFNTWGAAKRLACYWKKRVEVFKERAFLPMNQTGEGALAKKDVSFANGGYLVELPKDRDGRTVFFSDSTLRKKKDHEAAIRHFFYINHIAMQNPATPDKGVVAIMLLSRNSMDVLGRTLGERAKLAMIAFPFKCHSLHITPKKERPRSFIDEAIPYFFAMFPRTESNKYFHHYKDNEKLLQALEKHGISREGLPESIGGGWSFEDFITWQERRIRIEWDLPLGNLALKDCNFEATPMSALSEEERAERRRRYNVIHSRRKRRRDRMEGEILERQVEDLDQEQEEILEEYKRLKDLLSQAHRVVASFGHYA